MRFQYRHPRLYDPIISLLYPKRLLDAFRLEVGKDNSVFEVAAGYGRMARFIDPSNEYYGVDLNEIFVNYGRKKGVRLEIGDVFDPRVYKKSDVLIVVDFIHHLSPEKLKQLFDIVFANAGKKIVIVEPSFVSFMNKYGIFGRFISWLLRVIDDDGINRIEYWFTDEKYQSLFEERFGSKDGKNFEIKHKKLAGHHLITFSRK